VFLGEWTLKGGEKNLSGLKRHEVIIDDGIYFFVNYSFKKERKKNIASLRTVGESFPRMCCQKLMDFAYVLNC